MSVKVIINEPTIGLTDRTSYLAIQGRQNWWSLQRGNRGTATLTFHVQASDSYAPTVGTPIYLYSVNDSTGAQTIVYGGSIDKVLLGYLGLTGERFYTLSLVTFEQVLDTIYVNPPKAYSSTTAGAIVTDLLQTVCAGVPITAGSISNGPSIPSLTITNQRVSDVLTNLATQANFVWGVDQTTQSLYFFAANTTPAPFTLASASMLQDGSLNDIQWTQGRPNYRNRQLVQISKQAFAPSNVLLAGDGSTTVFSMPYIADSIISAADTTGTQATTTGAFSGVPSPNDTITVAGTVYTFKSTLDNTQLQQVLIGASASACAQNFVDAVNANPATAGTGYSMPTHENAQMNCDAPSGGTFTVRSKLKGSAQNSLVLSESCTNFTWAATNPSGGTDGTDVSKTVVVAGSGQTGDITFTQTTTTGHLAAKAVAFLDMVAQVGSPTSAYLDCSSASPSNGQAVNVGGVNYFFRTTATTIRDIQLSGALATNVQSIVDAINGVANPNVYGNSGLNSAGAPNASVYARMVGQVVAPGNTGLQIRVVSKSMNTAVSVSTNVSGASWVATIGGSSTSTTVNGQGASGTSPAIAYLNPTGGGLGQTVTINGVTYTTVFVLNNAVPNQILQTAAHQWSRIIDAINNGGDGTFVSSATVPHPDVEAFAYDLSTTLAQTDETFFVLSKRSGSDQNFAVGQTVGSAWKQTYGGSTTTVMVGGTGAGGTFVLGASTYTIQFGAVNNASFGQIFIGDYPSAATLATRIVNAINGVTDGVNVSNATTANASASASTTGVTGEVEAQALAAGAAGNLIACTSSLSAGPANWVTSSGGITTTTTLAGGLDNTLATVSTLTCATAPAVGHSLTISYYRLGSDLIAVENTSLVTARAATEHGTGKYQSMITDTSNISAAAGLLEAQQALAAYSVLVQSFKFQTDEQLLSAGQYLTISVSTPTGLGTLINSSTWIVQEIRGELNGPGAATSPHLLNWRYTVTVLNAQTLNYVQFWINLIP